MTVTALDSGEVPVIGQKYLVPCVYSSTSSTGPLHSWIPVLGTLHNDVEVIGFAQEHVHYDFRFLSDGHLYAMNERSSSYFSLNGQSVADIASRLMATVVSITAPPVLQMKLCHRVMPTFSHNKTFMKRLETAYRSERVQCGKCPHKGMDLHCVPADAEGRKVCPLHGLRWDAEGKLAPRVIA